MTVELVNLQGHREQSRFPQESTKFKGCGADRLVKTAVRTETHSGPAEPGSP